MLRRALPTLLLFACASSPHPKTTYADEIGGTTGAPICDEYLWKFKTCAEHDAFPESQRADWLEVYRKYREAWTNIPSRDPETQTRILQACTEGVNTPPRSYDNLCPNVFF